MKTTHILLAAVLAATSAIQAATAERKLPAPMPEFKTPEQLVKWRKEKTAAAEPHSESKNADAFFTGKPFIGESASYVFKFRQYDPKLSRWTTADSSGFPDGANNGKYLANPTSALDYLGCFALSTTSPSPRTSYDPSSTYYAEAYDLSHIGAGSGMAGVLSGLLSQYYQNFNVTVASSNLNGTANIQKYGARNTDRYGASQGALDLKVTFSGGGSDFSWLQLVRSRLSTGAGWSDWSIDTTMFGAPSYNISTDPVLDDLPTLGAWTSGGQASGASKEFYTFATIRDGTNITIHDAFYWGGTIKE